MGRTFSSVLSLVLVSSCVAVAAGPEFTVKLAPTVVEKPYDGRVYLMFGRAVGGREPRTGPDWFNTQPFYFKEVKGLKGGDSVTFDDSALGYPEPLSKLKAGAYVVQAVIRLNRDTHNIGGPGNAFSAPAEVTLGEGDVRLALEIDKVAPPAKFEESERVKHVDIPSKLLSDFYGRPIRMQAAVVLPEGDLSKKRATLYIIPGFGGDHLRAGAMLRSPRMGGYAKDLIRVVLNPDCFTGHHVFADSATNGPRGRALIEELIPYIEKTYPAIAEPRARLLNGHSSGGWSSLWLQVTYPDYFGGTWSTSPDPVDFRDFQQIDLYSKSANMFKNEKGQPRPLARIGGRAMLLYENFSKMEDIYGDGGQLHSFEAVFSPLGPDGRPRQLWDRKTGTVDAEVAKTWEKYDIRLTLERNWSTLGPKLKGKIHVYMGDMDTFYLEGATRLLKVSLEKLGSDAKVELFPGKDHGSILDQDLIERLDREIKAVVEKF